MDDAFDQAPFRRTDSEPEISPQEFFDLMGTMMASIGGIQGQGSRDHPPPGLPFPMATRPGTDDQSGRGAGPDRVPEAWLGPRADPQGCQTGGNLGAELVRLTGGDPAIAEAFARIGCLAALLVDEGVPQGQGPYESDLQAFDTIDAMIRAVRSDNETLAGLIGAIHQVMTADRIRILGIENAYRKRSITPREAHRQIAAINDHRVRLQQTAKAVKNREGDWVNVTRTRKQNGSDTTRLEAEIDKMKRQRAYLEQELELMDRMINVSPAAG